MLRRSSLWRRASLRAWHRHTPASALRSPVLSGSSVVYRLVAGEAQNAISLFTSNSENPFARNSTERQMSKIGDRRP
jgi:hypothetical protein